MAIFRLTNNNHFIFSMDGECIIVFDLSKTFEEFGKILSRSDYNSPHLYHLLTLHLTLLWIDPLGVVGPPHATYNGLEVFGVVIQGQTLEQLTTDLSNSNCITNREGYCILIDDLKKSDWSLAPKIHTHYRLNDLFIWAKYNVVPTITTVWNRVSMHDNSIILVNYEELHDELSRCKLSLPGKGTELRECKLKLTKLEKRLNDKDKSIERAKKEKEGIKGEVEGKKKELSRIKNRLKEEDKVLTEKRKELEECKRELEAKKKEVLTWKKSIDDKDKLVDLKSKELEVYKLRGLEAKKISPEFNDQFGYTAELVKELCECRKSLEEKDEELIRMGGQLLAKQGAVEALIQVVNNFKKP